jgi:SAM-dependent methyltransferase
MSVRDALYHFYWRAEKLITPGLTSSQYEYFEQLRDLLTRKSRWLDLGCGHQLFGDWMTREQAEVVALSGSVVGIDLDWEGLRRHPSIRRRIFGDLLRLPVLDGSFDVISANMVMEHIPEPTVLLTEVHRALSPGGVFIFHTPNFYHWGTFAA